MPSFTNTAAVATTSPAGPDNRDAVRHASDTEAGLGLGLSTEVLLTSFASKKSVGLGIYLDFETWDGRQPKAEDFQVCKEPSAASSIKALCSPSRTEAQYVSSSPVCPGAPLLSQRSVFSTLPVESIASRLDSLCLVHEDGCEFCNSPTTTTNSGSLPPIIECPHEYEHTPSRSTMGAGLGFNLEEWAGFTDIESVIGSGHGAYEN